MKLLLSIFLILSLSTTLFANVGLEPEPYPLPEPTDSTAYVVGTNLIIQLSIPFKVNGVQYQAYEKASITSDGEATIIIEFEPATNNKHIYLNGEIKACRFDGFVSHGKELR